MREIAAQNLPRTQYAALAAFRTELRRFLAFSEQAAAKVGLPPQQHQALLVVAGQEAAPSVGYVAEQLLIAPHTAAELVARMVEAELLTKTAVPQDKRRAALALTPKAATLLGRLTAAHLSELRALEPALARALGRLVGETTCD